MMHISYYLFCVNSHRPGIQADDVSSNQPSSFFSEIRLLFSRIPVLPYKYFPIFMHYFFSC